MIHLSLNLPYYKLIRIMSSVYFIKKKNIPAISTSYFAYNINFILMVYVKIGGSNYIPSYCFFFEFL